MCFQFEMIPEYSYLLEPFISTILVHKPYLKQQMKAIKTMTQALPTVLTTNFPAFVLIIMKIMNWNLNGKQ